MFTVAQSLSNGASLQDEFPFTWCPSDNSDTSFSSMAKRKPLPLSCIWAILWRNSRYRPKQTLLQKWTKCKRKHVHPEITPLRGGCFGFWRILPMWTWKIWNCTWISKTKKTLSSSKELWKYMEITPLDISFHHCSNPIFQLPQHVICKFGQQEKHLHQLEWSLFGGSCFGSKPFQTTCYSVCGILGLKTSNPPDRVLCQSSHLSATTPVVHGLSQMRITWNTFIHVYIHLFTKHYIIHKLYKVHK